MVQKHFIFETQLTAIVFTQGSGGEMENSHSSTSNEHIQPSIHPSRHPHSIPIYPSPSIYSTYASTSIRTAQGTLPTTRRQNCLMATWFRQLGRDRGRRSLSHSVTESEGGRQRVRGVERRVRDLIVQEEPDSAAGSSLGGDYIRSNQRKHQRLISFSHCELLAFHQARQEQGLLQAFPGQVPQTQR